MINNTQREFLDSLLSSDGIFFEIINEYQGVNLGIKVLYLERAISQNCQTFLHSLDKLYRSNLANYATPTSLDFIRALKLINDLCFNNDVKNGEFGIRPALTHYFSRLGPITVDTFQSTIRQMIKNRIDDICSLNNVTLQKSAHKTYESNVAKDSSWRHQLDLPQNQLSTEKSLFSRAVSGAVIGAVGVYLAVIADCGVSEVAGVAINTFINNGLCTGVHIGLPGVCTGTFIFSVASALISAPVFSHAAVGAGAIAGASLTIIADTFLLPAITRRL